MEKNDRDRELNALVRLIDEPDEAIFGRIREKILSYGISAIPVLEEAWENNFDKKVQNRLEEIIHDIQFENIKTELHNWCSIGTRNLLLGYLLITRYQYPELDENSIKNRIDRIKQDVWLEINDNMTGMEKIHVLNKIIFDVYKFEGSRTHPFALQNYYLNTVLESRSGSPLALGIIYLIVAQSLGIPVFGVNLPEHFILAYADISNDDYGFMHDENKILFYLNPFTKGTFFTRNEIDLFLNQINKERKKEYYLPCTNTEIIRLLLQHLMLCYEKLGQQEKISELEILLEIMQKC